MATIPQTNDVSALPLAPLNPLPYRQILSALRRFHTGFETLRDAGGPVTRIQMGPKWLSPPIVIVTSPRGAHDVLGRNDAFVDRAVMHHEVRNILGGNLFTLPNREWLPRRRTVQPVFTKNHVREFGGDMAQAALAICEGWKDESDIDVDEQTRLLTLRALGRSVLGLELQDRTDLIAAPLRVTLSYAADRAVRPVKAPHWLPTSARRRARKASDSLHQLTREILAACRADPQHEAPLVRELMAAVNPDTGRPLSDEEICDELIVFIIAGHDTTATTLAYALWQLGRHPNLQERVRAEVDALGAGLPAPQDLSRLTYTIQVLHEALRLCPPGAANSRTAMRDIEVDGYRVEAGSMVAVGVWAMHRDPSLWPDPLSFDPDRFAADSAKQRDRWQFIPFGAGPRKCIGDHFAMLEATLALATIIGRFAVTSSTSDFPVATPFTTVAAEPVHARVVRRSVQQRTAVTAGVSSGCGAAVMADGGAP